MANMAILHKDKNFKSNGLTTRNNRNDRLLRTTLGIERISLDLSGDFCHDSRASFLAILIMLAFFGCLPC